MFHRKKLHSYKKERCLFSDILPYEVPIIFTNRHLYRFFIDWDIQYDSISSAITWKKGDGVVDVLVPILFGIASKEKAGDVSKENTRPFHFHIRHKLNESRKLSIPHPLHQLQVIDFYDKYKELILYYCSHSKFSIRRPYKVAKYIYFKDKTHNARVTGENIARIEESQREYENMRSFFVYKEYSNIYKFYDSQKYIRCEKKYNRLVKVDISKCFDSIYTHSIAWAILGKTVTKENLNGSTSTFAGRFDQLLQRMNFNETHGILIGSEFSRIFAELILQAVDKKVYNELRKSELIHKVDYEIFRYVDDYFIFCKNDQHQELILNSIRRQLEEYKLSFNSSKTEIYQKPIITCMTRSKNRIRKQLNEKIIIPSESEQDTPKSNAWGMSTDSSLLITEFKTIIHECNVAYKEVTNYTLAILETKSHQMVKSYVDSHTNMQLSKGFIQSVYSILEFAFFIYTVEPRVNPSIRLCRIIYIFLNCIHQYGASQDHKDIVYRLIADEIALILRKDRCVAHTQIETQYLLLTLTKLGKEYKLSQNDLTRYFGIDISDNTKKNDLNYISILLLLFYMKNSKCYSELRDYIEDDIRRRFEKYRTTLRKHTELTLLFFDIMSCPYIRENLKRNILKLYGIKGRKMQKNIISLKRKKRGTRQSKNPQLWFTTWEKFDLGKELDAKRSLEVY